MNWLLVFLGVWPIALGVLLAFAARIDPRSGHCAARPDHPAAWARQCAAYCLQRTTIERFLTFAPKMPATVPPEVAPLSTSFDTTS